MQHVSLRDYQAKIVSEVYSHIRAGRRRILVQSPVGSGKTRTAARFVHDGLSRALNILFAAHRKELVTQPRDTFAAFDMRAGIVKAGFDFEPDLPLQIASVQTLVGKLDAITTPNLIILDEAHHATAGMWAAILAEYPDAIVIGLSGTPERADGTGLSDIFEVMVEGPSIPWLIERGYLVDCDVFGAPDRLILSKPRGSDYDPSKIIKALERKGRDGDPLVRFQAQHKPGKRGVGFGPSVEFCEHQAERFQSAGFKAFCLSAATPDDDRDAILAGYETGDTDFVWNVDVIGEGTDIPDLEILIDCAKTMSIVRYIQRAGRILRPADGKICGIYEDLVGNVAEHGHPCIARKFSLQGSAGRVKASEVTEDGEHLSTRQCNTCFQHYPTAPVCKYCGADNGPDKRISKERAAEIRKLEKEELAAAKKEAAKVRLDEERACGSLQELQALGTRRGYAPGWAFKRWKTMGGRPKPAGPKFGLDGWPT
ncbi:DEAD/DEAH box helicase [Cribrihabitans marinus]|nr:DEAD/DEAH box helicase [Cribrihabitans marinus]